MSGKRLSKVEVLCSSAFHGQCLHACPPELCNGSLHTAVLRALPPVLQAAAELLHQGQQLWSAAVAAGSDQELLSSSAGMMYFSALRQASALCFMSLLLRRGPPSVLMAPPALSWAKKSYLAMYAPLLLASQHICAVVQRLLRWTLQLLSPQHTKVLRQPQICSRIAQSSLLQCLWCMRLLSSQTWWPVSAQSRHALQLNCCLSVAGLFCCAAAASSCGPLWRWTGRGPGGSQHSVHRWLAG